MNTLVLNTLVVTKLCNEHFSKTVEHFSKN